MTNETKAILAEMNAAADRLAETANRATAQAEALKADTPKIVEMAMGYDEPDPEFVANEERNRQARIKDTIERSKGKVPVQVGGKWIYVDPARVASLTATDNS